jgi:hypothetical protein
MQALTGFGSIGRRLRLAAVVMAVASLAAAPAGASVIFVLSETPSGGFESLPVYDNFDGVSPKDAPLVSILSGGITYAPVTGCGDSTVCPGNVWVTGFPYSNFGITGNTVGAILTATGNEYFTMTPSFTIRSLGFDVYTNNEVGNPKSVFGGAADVIVTVLTSSGNTVLNLPAPSDNFGFLGIVSDDPILMVTWQADKGGIVNTGIDNVRLSEQTVVPEPATLLLLGSGITGLALRRRRRSQD